MAILEGFELLQRLPPDSSTTLAAQVIMELADIFDQTYEQTESPDTLFGFEVRTVDWKTSDAIIVCGPPYIGTEGG